MDAPPILGTLESALYTDDLEAAEAFYAGTLGLAVVTRQPGRHVFFRTGASILLVFDPAATALRPALLGTVSLALIAAQAHVGCSSDSSGNRMVEASLIARRPH